MALGHLCGLIPGEMGVNRLGFPTITGNSASKSELTFIKMMFWPILFYCLFLALTVLSGVITPVTELMYFIYIYHLNEAF